MTRTLLAGVLAAVLAAGTSACSSGSAGPDLGRVPIPTGSGQPTATAGPHHPALLDIGAPLRVDLGTAQAEVTASGPVQSVEFTGTVRPTRTGGTFTVLVRPTRGAVTVRAADFSSRDDTGTPVRLHAMGAAAVRATPGHPAQLRLVGTYGSGAAQLSWRVGGRLVAIWDFNIELD